MAIYNTTSEFTDLVGTMDLDITDNHVNSYTSNTQDAGTVTNTDNKESLEFTVYFAKNGTTYTIDATANGAAFSGEANNGGPTGGEEAWSATASTADTATQKAAY